MEPPAVRHLIQCACANAHSCKIITEINHHRMRCIAPSSPTDTWGPRLIINQCYAVRHLSSSSLGLDTTSSLKGASIHRNQGESGPNSTVRHLLSSSPTVYTKSSLQGTSVRVKLSWKSGCVWAKFDSPTFAIIIIIISFISHSAIIIDRGTG